MLVVLIMYVNSVSGSCILLSLFYLYCVQIALLYSNVRLSHRLIKDDLFTYFFIWVGVDFYTRPPHDTINRSPESVLNLGGSAS